MQTYNNVGCIYGSHCASKNYLNWLTVVVLWFLTQETSINRSMNHWILWWEHLTPIYFVSVAGRMDSADRTYRPFILFLIWLTPLRILCPTKAQRFGTLTNHVTEAKACWKLRMLGVLMSVVRLRHRSLVFFCSVYLSVCLSICLSIYLSKTDKFIFYTWLFDVRLLADDLKMVETCQYWWITSEGVYSNTCPLDWSYISDIHTLTQIIIKIATIAVSGTLC